MTTDKRQADALDRWVLETAPGAVAYATSLLHDSVRAEDVVQDCYCRLLQRREKYDLLRDGAKLLYRAVTNACLNVLKRRRPVLNLSVLGAGEDGSSWEPADDAATGPETTAMLHELESALADGLARLPVQHRAAIELKSLGHSQQEVGACLGISAGNAGVLIHRARQTLMSLLAPFFDESDA